MSNLQVFKFKEQVVDIIIVNGEPYFIGGQVAGILGYANTKDAILKHVDEEDKKVLSYTEIQKSQIATFASPRGLTVINESGLYSLILSSKLESAKAFKRWVTSEVLPSIRKTGNYNIKQSREQLRANALVAANEIIGELKTQIAALQPKATAYDAVMETFDSVSWRNFCNKIRDTLGVKENEIRAYLLEKRLIYKVNEYGGGTSYRPYKETIDRGLMIVKDTPCADGKLRPCNYITYKGQQALIDHFAPTVAVE